MRTRELALEYYVSSYKDHTTRYPQGVSPAVRLLPVGTSDQLKLAKS